MRKSNAKSDEQKAINKRNRDEKRNIEAKARLQPIADVITQLHGDGYFVTTINTADLLGVSASFMATVMKILTRIGEIKLAEHKLVLPRNHCRGARANKTYIPAGAQQLSIAGRSTVELTDENIETYRTFDANTLRHGRFKAYRKDVQINNVMRKIVKTMLSTNYAMTYKSIAVKHGISERTARNYTATLLNGNYIYMYSFRFVHESKPQRYFTTSMKKAARHLDDVKPLKSLPVVTNGGEIDVMALANNVLNKFTVLNYPRLEA